jgi:thymidylate synthase (FAD)
MCLMYGVDVVLIRSKGSEGVVKLEGVDEQIVDDYAAEALTAYQVLLEAGVAPEQSRMVLPQSTMTEWWWSGSLDAFADMCNLRRKEDTQYETRLVANSISMDMKRLFPISWGALVL